MPAIAIHDGDALGVLTDMANESAHCIVTSPPYWGLRNYGGFDGEIGREPTPAAYVAGLVTIFEEARRVLRKDGTCWVNMGDTYAASAGSHRGYRSSKNTLDMGGRLPCPPDRKPKDLLGLPWRLAFAMQDAGWWLRADIVWDKTDGMPESIVDRPTRNHEYIFMFARSRRYHYDIDAVREPHTMAPQRRTRPHKARCHDGQPDQTFSTSEARDEPGVDGHPLGRNRRAVWRCATSRGDSGHPAPFPPDLIEPCVLAGCPPGGVVLDPFCGSGTTGRVAARLGRDFVGIELNPAYAHDARRAIYHDAPLFNAVAWPGRTL